MDALQINRLVSEIISEEDVNLLNEFRTKHELGSVSTAEYIAVLERLNELHVFRLNKALEKISEL